MFARRLDRSRAARRMRRHTTGRRPVRGGPLSRPRPLGRMSVRDDRTTSRRLDADGFDTPDTVTDDDPDGPPDDVTGTRVVRDSGPRRPSGATSLLPPRPVRDERVVEEDGPVERPERRELVPVWVKDPWPTVRWWLGDRAHAVAFHLLRLHVYVMRAAWWTPRGLHRGLVGLWRWASDYQGAGLRWQAADLGDVDGYLYLSRQRDERVRNRTILVALALAAIGVAGLVAWTTPLGRLVFWAVVIGVGGWLGRPADRPLLDHAVLPPSQVRITPDLLVEACCAAKLCNRHDDPERHRTVTFLQPVARDGKGWRAVVDLPGGHTASTALKRREAIAAGLGIDEVRVFLDRVRGDEGSARRVSMWVADRDPYAAKPTVSPLTAAQQWNFWDPVPFGDNARGQQVLLFMVFTSLLIGGIPRMGKTYVARLVAAAAALDPRVREILFDGKGGPDWRTFAQIAYRCGFGPRDPVVEHLAQVLRECCADMEVRYETLAALPFDVCPESKVTPAICANRRLDMPLTLITIDEVQEYLGHPLHGASILDSLIRLAKVGPAVGYILNLATQRPDSATIPPALRDVIGTRFSLKAMTWQTSETILGAGTYKAGLDASKFQRSHKGVGILLGADDGELADDGPQTIRTHLLVREDVEAICARGRALRVDAGTLEGAAAGEQLVDDTPRRNLLDDIAATFGAGESKLWSETICARLAEDHPDTYGGWGPVELAAALTPYGIATDQLWGRDDAGVGRNRRGVVRQHVLDAQAARVTTARPLATQGGRDPGTASSSTPASATDQATSPLATRTATSDRPGAVEPTARSLAGGPQPDDDEP